MHQIIFTFWIKKRIRPENFLLINYEISHANLLINFASKCLICLNKLNITHFQHNVWLVIEKPKCLARLELKITYFLGKEKWAVKKWALILNSTICLLVLNKIKHKIRQTVNFIRVNRAIKMDYAFCDLNELFCSKIVEVQTRNIVPS